MAGARPFFVSDSGGVPLLGGAAGMSAAAYSAAGVSRGARTISEKSHGHYQITPTDSDEAERTVILIDCGAGRMPRRITMAAFLPDGSNQFWAFHVEDSAGALWAGAAPAIASGSYLDAGNVLRAAPALVPVLASYLWAAVPTPSDVAAGVVARFDLPAGAIVPYISGWTERQGVIPGPYDPPRTGGLVRSSDGSVVLR